VKGKRPIEPVLAEHVDAIAFRLAEGQRPLDVAAAAPGAGKAIAGTPTAFQAVRWQLD